MRALLERLREPTNDYTVTPEHRHGEIALLFGLASLAMLWLAHRRSAPEGVRRPLRALCVLLALQGAVGLDQYEAHLPTELVWAHVGLACAAWLTVLWVGLRARLARLRRAPPRPGAIAGGAVAGRFPGPIPRKLGLLRRAVALVGPPVVHTSG